VSFSRLYATASRRSRSDLRQGGGSDPLLLPPTGSKCEAGRPAARRRAKQRRRRGSDRPSALLESDTAVTKLTTLDARASSNAGLDRHAARNLLLAEGAHLGAVDGPAPVGGPPFPREQERALVRFLRTPTEASGGMRSRRRGPASSRCHASARARRGHRTIALPEHDRQASGLRRLCSCGSGLSISLRSSRLADAAGPDAPGGGGPLLQVGVTSTGPAVASRAAAADSRPRPASRDGPTRGGDLTQMDNPFAAMRAGRFAGPAGDRKRLSCPGHWESRRSAARSWPAVRHRGPTA
jgi:hypothetical protein